MLNRVRVNGIGPLMVQPATPHIDNTLGGPIDIQHFAQWNGTPPPPPPQYGNPMVRSFKQILSFKCIETALLLTWRNIAAS